MGGFSIQLYVTISNRNEIKIALTSKGSAQGNFARRFSCLALGGDTFCSSAFWLAVVLRACLTSSRVFYVFTRVENVY